MIAALSALQSCKMDQTVSINACRDLAGLDVRFGFALHQSDDGCVAMAADVPRDKLGVLTRDFDHLNYCDHIFFRPTSG